MEQKKNSESPRDPSAEPDESATPQPLLTDHMPAVVAPLVPSEPETAFTQTRRLRHDGWTPEKKQIFLRRFAECGIFVEACRAAGMSARAAYNLRDRDPLFAAGLDAACVKARAPLADEAYSRGMNGVVERIYKDGIVIAERHRYDNRMTMAVLTRLDSRIGRAEEKGSSHLRAVEHWDEFLDAIGEDRREDGLALLAPKARRVGQQGISRDHELDELHLADAMAPADPHEVWREDEGGWWTDYPPPAGFDGEEEGRFGDEDYRRALSPSEQAKVDSCVARLARKEAEALAAERSSAEAQRDEFFSLIEDSEGAGTGDSSPLPLDSPRLSCHSRPSRSGSRQRPDPGRRSRRSRRRKRKRG